MHRDVALRDIFSKRQAKLVSSEPLIFGNQSNYFILGGRQFQPVAEKNHILGGLPNEKMLVKISRHFSLRLFLSFYRFYHILFVF